MTVAGTAGCSVPYQMAFHYKTSKCSRLYCAGPDLEMICAQCGTAADPAARHCSHCNSDLSDPAMVSGTSINDLPTSTGAPTAPLSATADSLLPGHKFGPRNTILK